MKPFYWQGTTNFGDFLNSKIWPSLLDGYLNPDDNIRLIGIGSLLKSSINLLEGKKVIFGTGSGYGAIPTRDSYKDWDFYFVRGPRTAECFELPPSKGIIDGAWLLSLIPEYKDHHTLSKKGTTFIPHWTSADSGNWNPICQQADVNYLNPLDPLDSVLRSIATSELVITESLHGAIMADLFRTPWIPVNMSSKFLAFKWVDWFDSIKLNPKITNFPLSDFFEYFYSSRSTRNIDYSSNQISIKLTPPEKETIPHKETKPGVLYREKIRIKKSLRNLRRKTIHGLSVSRNIYPISTWNEKHWKKSSELLRKIAQQRPYLSCDQTRSEKIEQLEQTLEQLKTDYPNIVSKTSELSINQ